MWNILMLGLRYPCFAMIAVIVSACTEGADVRPLNEAAKQVKPIEASFTRQSKETGSATIILADGEVLQGYYKITPDDGGKLLVPKERAASPVIVVGGPVQFVVTGSRSKAECEGVATYEGRGGVTCQTTDGALWDVRW